MLNSEYLGVCLDVSLISFLLKMPFISESVFDYIKQLHLNSTLDQMKRKSSTSCIAKLEEFPAVTF